MAQIGKRSIGHGNPVFIIFEIGPTHDGLESAKKLIKASKAAGADAVKFQIIDPDRLVADRNQMFDYRILDANENLVIKSEPLYEILKRRSLNKDEWLDLKHYADSLDLEFFSTISFEDELAFIIQMNCKSVKIASADVNYHQLIRKAAETGLNIQLDTGMSSLSEIESAVKVVQETGNTNIIVHHCPSGYPALATQINLNIIKSLVKRLGLPVAYSDHYLDGDMVIAAIAMGACVIEKTITLDRFTPSVEHAMSIEPADMIDFVKRIRAVEQGLGSFERNISTSEIENRRLLRRGAYLTQNIKSGSRLSEADIIYKRPAIGLEPNEVESMKGYILVKDKARGETLMKEDLIKG